MANIIVSENRILEILESQGATWKDYVLCGDLILHVSRAGMAAVIVEDENLSKSCREFLIERGVRQFSNLKEIELAFGISDNKAKATSYKEP
jgi:hypothetical protein